MEIRSISASAALKVVAIAFAVLIGLRFLWIAHAIFLVGFLGVLLGLALSKATDWLEQHRVRRGLGAPATLIAALALIVGLGMLIAPSIAKQGAELKEALPKALEPLQKRFGVTPASALSQVASAAPSDKKPEQEQQPQKEPAKPQEQQPQERQEEQQQQGGIGGQIGKEVQGLARFLFPVISSVLGAVAGFVVILFIALYIAISPGTYREGLLHLVPHRQRPRAEEVLDQLRDTLRQWLLTRLLAMIAIGTLTAIGLALLRVKGAVALGVFAGFMELIPFFGPFISAIPAIGIALVDSPTKALAVAVLYLVMQQIEGNVITPLLLQKRLDVPPVMTVIGVSALGMVFGVLGMLIAEPLLAAGLVLTKLLYVHDVVGDEVKIGKDG